MASSARKSFSRSECNSS